MKTYSIEISGIKNGEHVGVTHLGIKGINKSNALLNLYRSCQVDPFIEDRMIVITEEK